MIGEFGIQFGAGGAASPGTAARRKSAAERNAAGITPALFMCVDLFFTTKLPWPLTFAPPLLRELTHKSVSICPLLLISMFDANDPTCTTDIKPCIDK
ncbi:MAG: hypothetical protein OHK0028_11190 [Deltaproteobacteria bacterium]